MQSNRRIGKILASRTSANKSLRYRMPMTNPFMSKSLISGAIIFFVAFFAAFFSSSVLTPTRVSDALEPVSASVSFEGYYVKLKTSDVAMNLITTPASTMTVVDSTVQAVTNSPNGYKLYLSMSDYYTSGAEKTSADKQKNGLYLDEDLSRLDNMVFNAVDGKGGSTSSASPAALTDNTWGYAVDKNSTGAPDVWLSENHSTMSSTTPTSDKFAAVPATGGVDLIQETTSSNVSYDTPESDVQDSDYTSANLYFGIRGNAGLQAGNYINTIAYTAVGKTEPTSSLTFNPASYTFDAPYESMVWDDTVTIQTPLYTSAEDLGTATVTLSGGPDNISGAACSNPTLSVFNNLLNVTCTLPQAKAGNYDVMVYLDKYGQIYTGSYTYIDPYNTSYTVSITNDGHISSSEDSISIPYGGTGYVEMTPSDGYYLSSVSCPTGYTCSNYSTGTSIPAASGTQVMAITNNNTTSGGTIAVAGGVLTEMQDQTAINTCKNAPVGTTYMLRDNRDNKAYAVRKLADGNCWMVQNLNLQGPITLTPSDSNVSSNWTLPAMTNEYDDGTAPSTTNKWCILDAQTCVDRAVNSYGGSTAYGTYYTWNAATAGTGTYSMTSGNASSSICPKGWRLPKGKSDGEFVALYNKYPSWDNMIYGPPAITRGPGYRYRHVIDALGKNGYLWSSTAYSSAYSNYLGAYGRDGDIIRASQDYYKSMGINMRCIAQ